MQGSYNSIIRKQICSCIFRCKICHYYSYIRSIEVNFQYSILYLYLAYHINLSCCILYMLFLFSYIYTIQFSLLTVSLTPNIIFFISSAILMKVQTHLRGSYHLKSPATDDTCWGVSTWQCQYSLFQKWISGSLQYRCVNCHCKWHNPGMWTGEVPCKL